jgi:hypothetical protein
MLPQGLFSADMEKVVDALVKGAVSYPGAITAPSPNSHKQVGPRYESAAPVDVDATNIGVSRTHLTTRGKGKAKMHPDSFTRSSIMHVLEGLDFLLRSAIHIEPWIALIAILWTVGAFVSKIIARWCPRKN